MLDEMNKMVSEGESPEQVLQSLMVAEHTVDETKDWLDSEGFEETILKFGGDPDDYRQQIGVAFGLDRYDVTIGGDLGGRSVQNIATPRLTDVKLPLEETSSEKDLWVQEHKAGKPGGFTLDVSGARDPADVSGLDWGANLQQKFYERIYAVPGMGRADILRNLPSLYAQTQAVFLLLNGTQMWNDVQTTTLTEGASKSEIDAARVSMGSLEERYVDFLERYLANPAQTMADPLIRSLSSDISRVLSLWESTPDVNKLDEEGRPVWNATDVNNLPWIRGLFGGRENEGRRQQLININLTGGGIDYYSYQIQSAALELREHYKTLGWSEAEIFDRMMKAGGRPAGVPPSETAGVAPDYFGDGAPPTAPGVMGQPPIGDIAPKDLPYGEWQQDMGMGDMPPTAAEPDYSDIFEQVGPQGQAAYQHLMGTQPTSFLGTALTGEGTPIEGELLDPMKWEELIAQMPTPLNEAERAKRDQGLPYQSAKGAWDPKGSGKHIAERDKEGNLIPWTRFVPTEQHGRALGIF